MSAIVKADTVSCYCGRSQKALAMSSTKIYTVYAIAGWIDNRLLNGIVKAMAFIISAQLTNQTHPHNIPP